MACGRGEGPFGHSGRTRGHATVDATLGAADTVLFGRKTYDSFAGAWPEREAAGGEDAPFAKALGDARKVVVSNQKLQLTWRNSEQLEGDLIQAVTALKNEPGGNIALSGSVSAESPGSATYDDAKVHLPRSDE
jgi:dihydrofolate reductase